MFTWGLIVYVGLWLILADVGAVRKAKLMGNPIMVHAVMPRKTQGYRIVETWDTLGMRATASQDTILEGAFVPDQYVIRKRGAGFAGELRAGRPGQCRRPHSPPPTFPDEPHEDSVPAARAQASALAAHPAAAHCPGCG